MRLSYRLSKNIFKGTVPSGWDPFWNVKHRQGMIYSTTPYNDHTCHHVKCLFFHLVQPCPKMMRQWIFLQDWIPPSTYILQDLLLPFHQCGWPSDLLALNGFPLTVQCAFMTTRILEFCVETFSHACSQLIFFILQNMDLFRLID